MATQRGQGSIPEDVVSIIIDHAWPYIVTNGLFPEFLELSLVSPTFHKVMTRKRDHFMMTQACLLQGLKGYDLIRAIEGCRPFSNRYVDKGKLLKNMMTLSETINDHYDDLEEIGKLLYQEDEWVQMKTARPTTHPIIFAHGRGDETDVLASSHCYRVLETGEDEEYEDETNLYLLKGVSSADVAANYEETWDYALLSICDWESDQGVLFLFRRYYTETPQQGKRELMCTEHYDDARILYTAKYGSKTVQ